MTRRFVSVPIALLCLLSHAAADARTLNADHYRDRLAGMWMGQILGNYAGRPYEGDCQRGGLTDVLDWDSASSFTRTDPWEGDDDTLFEYMYADLLAENASPSGSDVKAQWEQHMKVPAFYIANRQARYLMNQGYTPPQTGSHERNVYWFAIDSQITTESVGAMAPGMRQRASDLTGTLGGATNEGYALQAAQFYAAMYAAAPFGSDVEQLVQDGLAVVPAGSRTHQVITDTWDLYTADKADGTLDWRATQTSLFDNYGLRDDTGRYRGWVESTVNTAMTTLAVLYGQGDFKQTVEIGALAGFDADCNPATAGGLVGLMQGYDAILAAVPNATATDYEIPTLINYDSVTTVDAVAGLLQQAAEGQILAAGGTISGTGDQRTYTLPDDVVTSPGAIVYPDGPGGLVGAVKAAGGTVGVSASVERHQAADRGNLGQIMDGIIDVTQNGHVPYWTNDGNNPQPAGGDWYQVEFDRTVTFTALTFHEGDALLVKSWDKPVIEKLRGGYFEDLIVEVLQDGQYVQVELLSQSEPLEALKAFQHIELAFNP
ncbi:MAG: ADP-ribosylglycohydrolase family protein, partial [Phycisphaerae bacterium]